MNEKLMKILKAHDVDCETITDGTELVADLGLSSFDIIQMSVEVEDCFDIEIPDRAIKNLKTVGDVKRLIEELM